MVNYKVTNMSTTKKNYINKYERVLEYLLKRKVIISEMFGSNNSRSFALLSLDKNEEIKIYTIAEAEQKVSTDLIESTLNEQFTLFNITIDCISFTSWDIVKEISVSNLYQPVSDISVSEDGEILLYTKEKEDNIKEVYLVDRNDKEAILLTRKVFEDKVNMDYFKTVISNSGKTFLLISSNKADIYKRDSNDKFTLFDTVSIYPTPNRDQLSYTYRYLLQ